MKNLGFAQTRGFSFFYGDFYVGTFFIGQFFGFTRQISSFIGQIITVTRQKVKVSGQNFCFIGQTSIKSKFV
jgi:hypothetical protein